MAGVDPGQMNDDRKECYRLWRIWRTAKEMCKSRGYLVLPEDYEKTFEGWIEEYGDKPRTEQRPRRMDLNFVHAHDDNELERIFVFFSDQPNVSGDDLKAYMDRMREGSVTRAIIIYEGKVTPMGKTFMDHLNASDDMPYHMEVFRDKELMVNVTKHELVPSHEILSMDEKATLLQRYGLKESELGRIQSMDPVAKFYGVKPGQVFKIVRSSQTAGRYVSYRIVT